MNRPERDYAQHAVLLLEPAVGAEARVRQKRAGGVQGARIVVISCGGVESVELVRAQGAGEVTLRGGRASEEVRARCTPPGHIPGSDLDAGPTLRRNALYTAEHRENHPLDVPRSAQEGVGGAEQVAGFVAQHAPSLEHELSRALGHCPRRGRREDRSIRDHQASPFNPSGSNQYPSQGGVNLNHPRGLHCEVPRMERVGKPREPRSASHYT